MNRKISSLILILCLINSKPNNLQAMEWVHTLCNSVQSCIKEHPKIITAITAVWAINVSLAKLFSPPQTFSKYTVMQGTNGNMVVPNIAKDKIILLLKRIDKNVTIFDLIKESYIPAPISILNKQIQLQRLPKQLIMPIPGKIALLPAAFQQYKNNSDYMIQEMNRCICVHLSNDEKNRSLPWLSEDLEWETPPDIDDFFIEGQNQLV